MGDGGGGGAEKPIEIIELIELELGPMMNGGMIRARVCVCG